MYCSEPEGENWKLHLRFLNPTVMTLHLFLLSVFTSLAVRIRFGEQPISLYRVPSSFSFLSIQVSASPPFWPGQWPHLLSAILGFSSISEALGNFVDYFCDIEEQVAPNTWIFYLISYYTD